EPAEGLFVAASKALIRGIGTRVVWLLRSGRLSDRLQPFGQLSEGHHGRGGGVGVDRGDAELIRPLYRRVLRDRKDLDPEDILQRSEEHTSELQSRGHLVCRLLLEKKKTETDIEDGPTYAR